MSARHQQLLALRLKMNAGRRDNARSAKEEMERAAGGTAHTRTRAGGHKQSQSSEERKEDSSDGPVGGQSQAEERVDSIILPLLHEPVEQADSRWREQRVKARRKKGLGDGGEGEEGDEEERRSDRDESGRRRVAEMSSRNVFDPQTAHRQYERSLMHAQQSSRIHQHQQRSAADGGSSATSTVSSASPPLSSAPSDPYTGRAAPSSTAVDRLVADFDAAAKRKAAFSRRRRFNEQEDVSYISEQNRTYNKKIARAFDAYTIDIAQSLERGTAL